MDASPQPALLFIPDISGFTQFVNDTEITHSQFIIRELLEILIDSNTLGMKVSEIEGDAILFYLAGQVSSASAIADQAKKMFLSFHQHLKRYHRDRLCNCKACETAINLTLKIVAHHGTITLMKVKDREKLFGSDVILAHRLLKNDIPDNEYLLATRGTGINQNNTDNSWMELKEHSSTYEAGEVKFHYASLKPLHNEVKEPEPPPVKIYRSDNPVVYERIIHAPIEKVFYQVVDLKNRINFMAGIKDVKIINERHNHINHVGVVHQCIFNDRVGELVTSDFKITPDLMKISETDTKMPLTADWIVERMNNDSRVKVAFHMQFNPFMKLVFNLVMKKKFAKVIEESLDNLKRICEVN